jgi:hypothetical protein
MDSQPQWQPSGPEAGALSSGFLFICRINCFRVAPPRRRQVARPPGGRLYRRYNVAILLIAAYLSMRMIPLLLSGR